MSTAVQGEQETVLMERTTGGLNVKLKWLPAMEMVVLAIVDGDEMRAVTIPPDKAIDAFNHPYAYIRR